MRQWHDDVHLYASMAAKFQDDNAKAIILSKVGRSRRAESLFLGEDAVQYFTKQFHLSLEEAVKFGSRLRQDGVFVEVNGAAAKFANERVRYRFLYPSSKDTVHSILLQRCPGRNNQTNEDIHANATRVEGVEDDISA
jgi:hypothetical protein